MIANPVEEKEEEIYKDSDVDDSEVLQEEKKH
jgi:hypothetical protein